MFYLLQPRDASGLRSKYECVKKLLRGTKRDLFKTGGGPFKEPHIVSSDSEKTLYTILQPTIEGLPSPLDSDHRKLYSINKFNKIWLLS